MKQNFHFPKVRFLALTLLSLPLWGCSEDPVNERELDLIMKDSFSWTIVFGLAAGFLTTFLLRQIRHRSEESFPQQVRMTTLGWGAAAFGLWEILFSFKGWSIADHRIWTGLSLWVNLQHFLLVVLCLFVWYATTWIAVGFHRWSGALALWPYRHEIRSFPLWDERGGTE